MTRFLRILPFILLSAAAAYGQRDIGSIDVLANNKTVPVRVSAPPGLQNLALQAFGSHGRYRLVGSGYAYDIRFGLATPSEVRVEVFRGTNDAAFFTQVAAGTSTRNAFLRAADLAVAQTNGLGLRGFFASKLAFIGSRTGHSEVYVCDLFFGEVRQITSDRAIALSPRWSPDGSKVLYTSFYHSGFPDIFLMDLNAYERTTFASFRGTNGGARFSPDGRQAVMVLSGEGSQEIYVSNAQGRAISRRTRFDSVKSSPCWSPDGSRIAFASGDPKPQIYVMSAGGGPPRRISYGVSGFCSEPDWSRGNPDKIAFTMRTGGDHYQIAVYDFSKGESAQVSHAPFDGLGPCWLPDGRHLVYTARTSAQSRLCILDTETGKSTPISPSSFGSTQEADVWSP